MLSWAAATRGASGNAIPGMHKASGPHPPRMRPALLLLAALAPAALALPPPATACPGTTVDEALGCLPLDVPACFTCTPTVTLAQVPVAQCPEPECTDVNLVFVLDVQPGLWGQTTTTTCWTDQRVLHDAPGPAGCRLVAESGVRPHACFDVTFGYEIRGHRTGDTRAETLHRNTC